MSKKHEKDNYRKKKAEEERNKVNKEIDSIAIFPNNGLYIVFAMITGCLVASVLLFLIISVTS